MAKHDTTEQRRHLERTEADKAIREFQERGLYGSVTLRFQDGQVQLVERHVQSKPGA